ncbi:MAG: PadR family transcriptional regulator [Candidatus Diapherotrites archaeon]|nr:PadR family transcriptional regulator [Candidatus Diapherotrites archaeon]
MKADISSLSMLELQVLWFINVHETHGYGLIKALESKRGKALTPGTIYPILHKFETLGFIGVKETGERDKKVYSITLEGKDALKHSADEFVSLFKDMLEYFHCSLCEVPVDIRRQYKDVHSPLTVFPSVPKEK